MSDVQCPCCLKKIRNVEEIFEDESSMDVDVDSECPHCESTLRFNRTVSVDYEVKKTD